MKVMMLKTIKRISLIFLAVLLSGCEKDSDKISVPDDVVIPSHISYVSYSGVTADYGTTAGVSWKIELKILADLEFWGLQIKNVEFYFDDVHQCTITEAPYTFTYQATISSVDTHVVRAVYVIGGDNHKDVVIENIKTIKIGKK